MKEKIRVKTQKKRKKNKKMLNYWQTIQIVALLNALKKETDISTEKHKELKTKYKQLSRAVGKINNNKVDHSR